MSFMNRAAQCAQCTCSLEIIRQNCVIGMLYTLHHAVVSQNCSLPQCHAGQAGIYKV